MSNQGAASDITYGSGGDQQSVSAESTREVTNKNDDNNSRLDSTRLRSAIDENAALPPLPVYSRSSSTRNMSHLSSDESNPSGVYNSTISAPSLKRKAALNPLNERKTLLSDPLPQSNKRKKSNFALQTTDTGTGNCASASGSEQDGGVSIGGDDADTTASVETPTVYSPRGSSVAHDNEFGFSEEEFDAWLVRNNVQRCEGFLLTLHSVLKLCKANDGKETIALMAQELEKLVDTLNGA